MKSTYTPEAASKIEQGLETALYDVRRLSAHLLMAWQPLLKSRRASEYLLNGVARRLRTIQRCVENVFEICPLDRSELFSSEELADLDINLHAFVTHIYGVLDNLAWVILFEATKAEIPPNRRTTVSLLKNPIVKQHLPKPAVDLLFGDPKIKRWLKEHMKSFRDALAHRIPLYVPPFRLGPEEAEKYAELGKEFDDKLRNGDLEGAWAIQDQQTALGRIFPVFAHSFGDPDASSPVYFHAQMIADLNTIIAIVRAVCPVPEEQGL